MVLDVGVYRHPFCSSLRTTFYELLVGRVEYVLKKEDFIEHEQAQSKKTTVFQGETKTLRFVHAPMIYQSDQRATNLHHRSVAECAIHSLWNGQLAGDVFSHVYFIGAWEAASVGPGFAIGVYNVSRIQKTMFFMRTLRQIISEADSVAGAEQCRIEEASCAKVLKTWWFGVGLMCKNAFYSESLPLSA